MFLYLSMFVFLLGVVKVTDQLPQEESEKLSSLPVVELDPDESKPYEVHPLHGALPPPPVDQSVIAPSQIYDDGQVGASVHPTYGLLPPRIQQHDFTENSANITSSFNGSDSEPGGQSQQSSLPTTSSYAEAATSSSQFISQNSTSLGLGESGGEEKLIEITKLKAQVDDLTLQLREAQAEIKRKDDRILAMQQRLERVEKEKQTRSSFGLQSVRPFKLKMNGSDAQVHTLVTPSGNYPHLHGHACHSAGSISPDRELGEQPHAFGEVQAKPFNKNLVSRSKSSSPSASISFV